MGGMVFVLSLCIWVSSVIALTGRIWPQWQCASFWAQALRFTASTFSPGMDILGTLPLGTHDMRPKAHVGAAIGRPEFPAGSQHQVCNSQLEQPAQSNLQRTWASLYHLAETTWKTLKENHIAGPHYPTEWWVIVINYCFKSLKFRVVFYTTGAGSICFEMKSLGRKICW